MGRGYKHLLSLQRNQFVLFMHLSLSPLSMNQRTEQNKKSKNKQTHNNSSSKNKLEDLGGMIPNQRMTFGNVTWLI